MKSFRLWVVAVYVARRHDILLIRLRLLLLISVCCEVSNDLGIALSTEDILVVHTHYSTMLHLSQANNGALRFTGFRETLTQ